MNKSVEVVKYLNKAISLKPQSADLYNDLGNGLQALKKYEDAILKYRKAINLKPGFFVAHFNLANTFKLLENFKEAISITKLLLR